MQTKRGKIIVIEGGDGAGKATQAKLLVDHLEADGLSVATFDFPQYETNTFGKLIREVLDGKRGDYLNMDPRIASTLFAADRYESKAMLLNDLEDGTTLVLDRYVSANMLHQGAKIADASERAELMSWISHVEHEIFGLPMPDLVLYLKVPCETREALLKEQHGDRDRQPDIPESDHEHQAKVENSAESVMALYDNWHTIECFENGSLLSREAIHEIVYKTVSDCI